MTTGNPSGTREQLECLPAFEELTDVEKEELTVLVEGLRPKETQLFFELARHVGAQRCSPCMNEAVGSSQLAKLKSNLGKAGFEITRGKTIWCDAHETHTNHYKLVTIKPNESVERADYSPSEWRTARSHVRDRDAFTGIAAPAGTSLEMDHRLPHVRRSADEERIDVNDPVAVNATFQKLTRSHNLLKSRACESCEKTNTRPPWIGIQVFFAGDQHYNDELGCWGCPWAFPELAKAYLNGDTPSRTELAALSDGEREILLMRHLGVATPEEKS